MLYYKKLLSFLQTYGLFVSLFTGISVYCFFHFTSFLNPLKAPLIRLTDNILPIFIFFILFFSFCKIKLKEMRPRRWHFLVLAVQILVPLLLAIYLYYTPESNYFVVIESIIICIITPTAAAAAVIGGKLGGNESSETTMVILSNFATALCIPLFFPLFTSKISGTFFEQFLFLLGKIFPIIICPLFLAALVKIFFPKIHNFIVTRLKNAAFWLWMVNLSMVLARAITNAVHSGSDYSMLLVLLLVGLLATVLQFGIGKLIGSIDGQRITGGQGLGQKNMVFGLWAALSYLSPTVAISCGGYILWQNFFNAAQMTMREKHVQKALSQHQSPYQE
ncbi:MAG: hypothetical protein K6F05_03470 [Succinivibrio sp.]|nr:hypothetical protein [Succinivibrio sp.]